MLSAFGVEHGEISKVRLPMKGFRGRKPTKAQRQTAGRGGESGPQKIKGALTRATAAPISIQGIGGVAGKGLGKTGSFFERRPGLTGTALVGGGAAAGYHHLKKEPKR